MIIVSASSGIVPKPASKFDFAVSSFALERPHPATEKEREKIRTASAHIGERRRHDAPGYDSPTRVIRST